MLTSEIGGLQLIGCNASLTCNHLFLIALSLTTNAVAGCYPSEIRIQLLAPMELKHSGNKDGESH